MRQLSVTDQEVLEGLVLANKNIISLESSLVISQSLADAQRVTIVAMCASGNEPAICGFVGEGMADIAVIGNSEAAPGPAQVLKALQLADKGHGVLLLVLNNSGDILTSNIVCKQAEKLGMNIAKVIIRDELPEASYVENENNTPNRELCQGLVGLLPVLKIAAGAAKIGKALTEVAALAQECADNTATATIKASAESEESTVEDLVSPLIPQLGKHLQLQAEQPLLVIVNGNETASLREQLAIYRSCFAELLGRGYLIAEGAVNNYFSGQADVFAQICIAKLTNEQLELWNMDCKTPYFTK